MNFVKPLQTTVKENWYLGVICFGGPPVHFRIFQEKFVAKIKWIDEQMYQELFAVAQALPGPGSTKMLYCVNLIHDGFASAILAFSMWSLPGAIGMYGLSIGISKVNEALPGPVYALLSGLNSATVGIIALAAVKLAEHTITDRISRILVFLGAAAGMLYNALWYFPLLMLVGGTVTLVLDSRWLQRPMQRIRTRLRRSRTEDEGHEIGESSEQIDGQITQPSSVRTTQAESSNVASASQSITEVARDLDTEASTRTSGQISELPITERDEPATATDTDERQEPRLIPSDRQIKISWQFGTVLIVVFFLIFTTVMVLRGVVKTPPLLLSLFANLFLAGTIIFGGGPVVIPLLREYVVAEGWVSPRDFLLGLALIQAFPGPNFNFAVYLGSLAAFYGSQSSLAGAIIAYIAIYFPGIILVHGTMGLWRILRAQRWVKASLRGVNSVAVGLIYTAVYRLWEIGYIDKTFSQGTSLSRDPWWVVVTATSYVGGYWFDMNVLFTIVLGGIMGLIWYGVVSN